MTRLVSLLAAAALGAAAVAAPSAHAGPAPAPLNFVLIRATAGASGATNLQQSISGMRERTHLGPAVLAVGYGDRDTGGGMLASDQGGGPLTVSTSQQAGGLNVTLVGTNPTDSGPAPFGFGLNVDALRPHQSVLGVGILGNSRITTLSAPHYKVTSGSVTIQIVRGSGAQVLTAGDAAAGGASTNVATAGVGMQMNQIRARSGIAGAFVTGSAGPNASSWHAPNGTSGQWLSAAATGAGAYSFAGPAGPWSFDWTGAAVNRAGAVSVVIYAPVGSLWPYLRCAGCLAALT